MKNIRIHNKIAFISAIFAMVAFTMSIGAMPFTAMAAGGYSSYNNNNRGGYTSHGSGGNYNYGDSHGGYNSGDAHGDNRGGYSHPTPPAPHPVTYPTYYPVDVPTPVIVPVQEPVYTPVYTPVETPIYVQTPVYTTPIYTQPIVYNYPPPLSVSCNANTPYATLGAMVYWSAYAVGGSGAYDYSWSGSDQIYGTNSSADVSYNTPGVKYAAVTVYSSGQSVTVNCSNTVSVSVGQNYQNLAYANGANYSNNSNGNNLVVGCAADAKTVRIGTPVTWSVEASGASGDSYRYSWTGTNGFSGSQVSVSTAYETTGSKTASVTVTSPNGQSVTQACDSAVTVVSANQYINNPIGRANTRTNLATNGTGNTNGLSANSLFSLANIPWGWVAVLVILVLFGTVLYLVFNKPKV